MSRNFTHSYSLKISLSANFSTIINAAILALSLCSASSMIRFTTSNMRVFASISLKHSLDTLASASTPSAYTYSSELIISFVINGKSDSVRIFKDYPLYYVSASLPMSLMNKCGTFQKNCSFRNSYSVQYISSAGIIQSSISFKVRIFKMFSRSLRNISLQSD